MDNVSLILAMLTTGLCLSTGMSGAAKSDLKTWDQWQNALKPKGQTGSEITLSVAGETDYFIVIPDTPTTQEKKAAEDLAHWLQEMTGATFPVILDSEVKVSEKIISIGRTNQFLKANITGSERDMGDEGYGIALEDHQNFYGKTQLILTQAKHTRLQYG